MDHLLAGKQSQFVTFYVVLGPCWCANEVMHVHQGQPSLHEAGIDPGKLQVRCVDESCMHCPRSPGLRGEPRFDQQDTPRGEMLCHTLGSSGELIEGLDVANGAEETGDDVKRVSESKVYHV